MPASPGTAASVVSLWRYPVKSMQGEQLDAADITERGLLGDRAYALIDASNGKVVSAKNPRKWQGLLDAQAVFDHPPHPGEGMPSVRITLSDGTVMASKDSRLEATLSARLGREVTLESAASQSPSLEEYWPDVDGLDHRDTVTDEAMPSGTFFDLAPVHLLTTATIDRLRELYPEGRVEVRRFRPNILVDSGPGIGFVEKDWIGHTLAIGGEVRLRVTGPCPRCVMTTLPQGDLPKDPGILRTAAQHNDVHVGVYATVERGGTIRRGDPITIE